MTETERGSGRTTQQMKQAPRGAIFVWVNGWLRYPAELASALDRSDLKIYGPSILEHGAERLRGLELSGIVIDHDAKLTSEQWSGYERVLPMVRSR